MTTARKYISMLLLLAILGSMAAFVAGCDEPTAPKDPGPSKLYDE